jgi:hypothetical protein
MPGDAGEHEVAPGVIEVTLDIDITTAGSALDNYCVEAVQAKLGVELPHTYDNVMCLMENCYPIGSDDCSYAGYAYINDWLSLYVTDYYAMPGVTVRTTYMRSLLAVGYLFFILVLSYVVYVRLC